MKLNFMITCVAVGMILSASAQDKIKFNSINSGGIILGEQNTYGSIQTVNGLRLNKWFAGIGTGYDFYYYSSVPLFIDGRRYLGRKSRSFLYGDMGYNFPGKYKPKNEVPVYTSYNFSGGIYTDIGAGVGFLLKSTTSVFIAAGYSYKNLSNKVGFVIPCINPPCPQSVENYDYDFNRILIKAGIIF